VMLEEELAVPEPPDTCTVKEYGPALPDAGVPLNTPPDDKVSPAGRVPDVTDHEPGEEAAKLYE
jgi:hypothetical protein